MGGFCHSKICLIKVISDGEGSFHTVTMYDASTTTSGSLVAQQGHTVMGNNDSIGPTHTIATSVCCNTLRTRIQATEASTLEIATKLSLANRMFEQPLLSETDLRKP